MKIKGRFVIWWIGIEDRMVDAGRQQGDLLFYFAIFRDLSERINWRIIYGKLDEGMKKGAFQPPFRY